MIFDILTRRRKNFAPGLFFKFRFKISFKYSLEVFSTTILPPDTNDTEIYL